MIEDENLLLKYRLIYGYDYATIADKFGGVFRGNVSKQIKEILKKRGLEDLDFKLKTGNKPKKNIKNKAKIMKKEGNIILPSEPQNEEERLIIKYRIEDKMTLEQIAKETGRSRQYISKKIEQLLRN